MASVQSRISNRPIARTTSDGLPSALASKLQGVCTAGDPVVQEMLQSFREVTTESEDGPAVGRVTRIDLASPAAAPAETVIAVGASLTSIPNPLAPQKVVGYVKVASVRLDMREVAQLT